MARIDKKDHPTILRMIDVEQRKVAEVAAEYGCTPANIYALLGKLRRRPAEGQLAIETLLSAPVAETDDGTGLSGEKIDPEATVAERLPENDAIVLTFERAAIPIEPKPATASFHRENLADARPAVSASPVPIGSKSRRAGEGAAIGAKLAKPGFGLMMRTSDGEENLTPFRSLDDLLSAIKPILRASARSPDPVWFSLQPVDLATIDVDAG